MSLRLQLFWLNNFSHSNIALISSAKKLFIAFKKALFIHSSKWKNLLLELEGKSNNLSSLNVFSSHIKSLKDHELYEKVLERFDKKLKFRDIPLNSQKEFVSDGHGRGSLNSYRKVQHRNETLFEKVYFSDHLQFKRLHYFNTNIAQFIATKINFPKVTALYSGELFTVVYSQWINLLKKRFTITQLIEEYKVIESALDQVEVPDSIPECMTLKNSISYTASLKDTKKWFKVSGPNNLSIEEFESIKLYVENNRSLVFCHGDFHYNNIFKDSVVLDWDEMGFYPKGYDLALLLSRYRVKKIELLQFLLNDCYGNLQSKEDWLAVYYFLFIGIIQQAKHKGHSVRYINSIEAMLRESWQKLQNT